MRLRPASTPGLVDQEGSVVPGGAASLHDLARRLAPDFERAEPRQRAMAARRGLLRPAERTHRWPWAEGAGDATPDALQHRRRRARWDPAAVRAARRRAILPLLGAPEAVLVLDAPGVRHTGHHAAGVARPVPWSTAPAACA
jgi:SRSO17 transposase